jgi:hypothetical protein
LLGAGLPGGRPARPAPPRAGWGSGKPLPARGTSGDAGLGHPAWVEQLVEAILG